MMTFISDVAIISSGRT